MMTLEKYLKQGEITYDPDFQYIWIASPKGETMIANVRGWGTIKNLFAEQTDAALFQDRLGQFMVDAIKEKIERDYGKT